MGLFLESTAFGWIEILDNAISQVDKRQMGLIFFQNVIFISGQRVSHKIKILAEF